MKVATKKTLFSIALYLSLAIFISYLLVKNRLHHLEVGHMAPLDEAVKMLHGSTITFKSLNQKPLLINFWATWCPTCKEELSTFNRLFFKYQNNINFIGIAVDSDLEEIKTLVSNQTIYYPIGFINKKSLDAWQIVNLPTTYLIDKDGKILWVALGKIDDKDLQEVLSSL